MVDRPQGVGSDSVAYCCRIINFADPLVLSMQTIPVPEMTAQVWLFPPLLRESVP